MKDAAFRQDLRERRVERQAMAGQRERLMRQMAALVEAKKKELGAADEAKLKAELEKDAEWRSLRERCVDLNTAMRENRQKAMAAVRTRLMPKKSAEGGKEISK